MWSRENIEITIVPSFNAQMKNQTIRSSPSLSLVLTSKKGQVQNTMIITYLLKWIYGRWYEAHSNYNLAVIVFTNVIAKRSPMKISLEIFCTRHFNTVQRWMFSYTRKVFYTTLPKQNFKEIILHLRATKLIKQMPVSIIRQIFDGVFKEIKKTLYKKAWNFPFCCT